MSIASRDATPPLDLFEIEESLLKQRKSAKEKDFLAFIDY